jgi:hypothetical protein
MYHEVSHGDSQMISADYGLGGTEKIDSDSRRGNSVGHFNLPYWVQLGDEGYQEAPGLRSSSVSRQSRVWSLQVLLPGEAA